MTAQVSKISGIKIESYPQLAVTGQVPYVLLGTTNYATLSQALTTIGSAQTTLSIPAAYGAVSVTTNTTIPANVHLRIDRGSYFNISNGVTLTIKGTLEAGIYKIFSWSGTGKVVFGTANGWGYDAKVRHAYPEWWGAVGDSVTDDLAALNACRSALSGHAMKNNGIGIMHLNSLYAISDTFSLCDMGMSNQGNGFEIRGIGKDISGFISLAGCDGKPIMEVCGANNIRCYDMCLVGSSINIGGALPEAAPSVALFLSRSISNPNGSNLRFREFWVTGFFRRGCIYNVGVSDSHFEQIIIQPSTMNDGQFMFNICVANNSAMRPFPDIVPTNGTISTTSGGAEGNRWFRIMTGGEYTRSKGSGNACFYFVGQGNYIDFGQLGGNFDYQIYALNAPVSVRNTSGDGGGAVAGIYLCSDSNGTNYPTCQASAHIEEYTNKIVGGTVLKTDAYTTLANSYCRKMRGNGTFVIDLGAGLQDSRILDMLGMIKFSVGTQTPSSSFRNNEIDIPSSCQDIKINTAAYSQTNKINDLRYTGSQNVIWYGVGEHRLDLPGVISNSMPSLYFGKNKVTYGFGIPTSGSWVKGDAIFNATPSPGGTVGWSCIISNTFGTLNSGNTTGSISVGTNILTINSYTGLHIGDVIDVAGAITQGVVRNINYSDKTVILDKNASATVTGAAVSFHNETSTDAFKAWANIGN